MRYVNCIYCGKYIKEGEVVVRRKGFTGNFCSWRCACLNCGFFEIKELSDSLVKEDKECNNVDWGISNIDS